MGEAMIPDCEIVHSIMSMLIRFFGKAEPLGHDAAQAAVVRGFVTDAEAVKQRGNADPNDDKEVAAQMVDAVTKLYAAIAAGATLAISALSDRSELEARQMVADQLAAHADLLDGIQEVDFTKHDQPGLIEIVYLGLNNPEERLATLQKRIDEEEDEHKREGLLKPLAAGLAAMVKMRGALANPELKDDYSNSDVPSDMVGGNMVPPGATRSIMAAYGAPVADKLREEDVERLLLDLNALPETPEPDQKDG